MLPLWPGRASAGVPMVCCPTDYTCRAFLETRPTSLRGRRSCRVEFRWRMQRLLHPLRMRLSEHACIDLPGVSSLKQQQKQLIKLLKYIILLLSNNRRTKKQHRQDPLFFLPQLGIGQRVKPLHPFRPTRRLNSIETSNQAETFSSSARKLSASRRAARICPSTTTIAHQKKRNGAAAQG